MKHNFKPYLNKIFIESGSYEGDGIQAALDAGFEQVWSIELASHYHERCKQRFFGNERVKLFLGSSIEVLPELMKVVYEPATFWLDGHYSGGYTAKAKQDVPIMEELSIISKHFIKTHTILIDDMRAVGTGGRNTDWGRFTKQEVEEMILSINSDYSIQYDFGVTVHDILIAQVVKTEGTWVDKLQTIYKRVYSQSYQDGILQSIFQNIGVTNKFCVEFGFNSKTLTGGSGANVARLVVEDGWYCLLLDGSFENKEINLHREFLTEENIVDVFEKYLVPTEPDYVSIDVDSIDLWLMKAMLDGGYRPRVISVEYNSNFPLEYSVTMGRNNIWGGDMLYGASLSALNEVAEEFGYVLVAVVSQLDLFFVRKELIPEPHPKVTKFARFTGLPLHPQTTKERCLQVVGYPGEIGLTEKTIKTNAHIFRTK